MLLFFHVTRLRVKSEQETILRGQERWLGCILAVRVDFFKSDGFSH